MGRCDKHRKFAAQRRICAGRIHFARALKKEGPRPAGPGGSGKKKMRSLGSVQLPTEAFMAVLKLDEE